MVGGFDSDSLALARLNHLLALALARLNHLLALALARLNHLLAAGVNGITLAEFAFC